MLQLQPYNLSNNVFWGEDAKSGQISANTNCLGTITNCAYTSLSTYFIGTVTNTVDITSTSTGLFTDPANNLWTLASGSVLMDMGTATGAPGTDLIGTSRPQGSGVDIGAYERTITTALAGVKRLTGWYSDGNLIINGVENNQPINIYNIAGKKVFSANAGSNVISVPLHKGIYIVNTKNTNTKNSCILIVLKNNIVMKKNNF